MKYYLCFENGAMHIKEYDPANGIKVYNEGTYKERTLIYHHTMIVNRLFDSIEAAIRDLNGYSKPVVLPDNSSVIPEAINFPNDFIAQCAAIGLYQWHSNIVELWPGELS